MNGPRLQRVAGLSGAPDLLRELGVDPRDACAGFFSSRAKTPFAARALATLAVVALATLEWVNEER